MQKTLTERISLWLITLFGLLGLVDSFIMTLKTMADKTNSHVFDSCSINAVINCTTTAHSKYAYFAGISVSLLGLLFFEAVFLIGFFLLAGFSLSVWQKWLISILSVLGLLFALRLFYYSYFGLGVICPYCLGSYICTLVVVVAWFLYIKPIKNKEVSPNSSVG